MDDVQTHEALIIFGLALEPTIKDNANVRWIVRGHFQILSDQVVISKSKHLSYIGRLYPRGRAIKSTRHPLVTHATKENVGRSISA